ncbi:aldo/keto reductase family oxidoreductase [uncultured Dubosiella sp.]|uniref:aldo/keto reductase n=1 Tax=uncultured Dubosiella sp. TaxID=1937011 RepID=UPI0025B50D40|nr:aldo/keto reductase [uncultured Dubosiella sp.]
MNYLKLPNTDLEVSQIALGCMRIADKTVDEVERLVQCALDLGVNFFDHADIYGGGRSERLFGEALARHPEWRERMVIQTKCAIVPGQRYDFSYDHIVDSVNQSLERLHTDHVEILLLHRPDALCDPREVARAFDELYEAGKVKYFGVSNHTPLQILLLEKYLKHKIVINQLQLSIVHSVIIDSGLNMNMTDAFAQDKDGGVLDWCRLNDVQIQAWSIVQASWADGTFLNNPKYGRLNEALERIAARYSVSKATIATAWILRHPARIQAIAGTTSCDHLKENVDACRIELTRQEWYDLYMAAEKPLP